MPLHPPRPRCPHPRRFIKQEAEEKAAEIAVSAEEEFNITKLQVRAGAVACGTGRSSARSW